MSTSRFIIPTIIITLLFLMPFARAEDEPIARLVAEYRENELVNRLVIDYEENDLFLTIEYMGRKTSVHTDCREVDYAPETIRLNNELTLEAGRIVWNEIKLPIELLKLTDLQHISQKRVYLEFEIRDSLPKRRIPRDIISAFVPLSIDSEQFVRGDAVSFGGDIDLHGEVSGNVICLFGDITMHTGSLVRGDAIALCGQVYRHQDSQVYGQIVSQRGWERGGRKYGSRRGYYSPLSLKGDMDYNRVDGLYLETFLEYEDPDFAFPKVEIGFGYAFQAERLRYRVEASQRIFDFYSIEPYGKIYRETASEDNNITGRHENMIYALIVNEDFRDYYEKEGGAFGLKVHVGHYNTFDFQYSYDRLRWMDAHPELWSLFGKKKFRDNFSSLPDDVMEENISDFDGKLSLFSMTYSLDIRDNIYKPRTGWTASAHFEKGGGDLKGDLSYSRWYFDLCRYQSINRFLALNLRLAYGSSSDELPLFKKFYLGGMRTLRGYNNKRFYGDQMLLANAEYVIDFRSYLHGMIFFDIGKVTGQDNSIFSDDEFKSDIGLGLGFSPSFRIELVKPLDNSEADLKVWVLFAKSF